MDTIDQAIREDPFAIAYIGILILGGLLALLRFLLVFQKQKQLGLPGVTPWRIRTSDFILFIFAFLFWFFFATAMSLDITGRFYEGAEPPMFVLMIVNTILHLGLIILFFRWRSYFRTLEERPLNLTTNTLLQSIAQGAFLFFASLPLVYASSLVWSSLLTFARSWGLDINLDPQDAISLYQQESDPWVLAFMVLVTTVIAPISEELIFRAGLFRFLIGKVSTASAIFFTATLFGFIHANIASFLPLSVLGGIFCAAYLYTGNIRVPIVMHALFNLNTLIILSISPNLPF